MSDAMSHAHGNLGCDEAVMATNDDAASCKRFAIHLGYWKDNYIQHFVKLGDRKTPEINRGYYARVKGMESILRQFLRLTKQECQVVSLGAGFDTKYWQLKEIGLSPKAYFEVDFKLVTMRKCMLIRRKKALQVFFEQSHIKYGQDELHSEDYHLISCDLRNISELEQKLAKSGLDKSVATIFLTECVLVYLRPEQSEQLLQWAGTNFTNAVFVNYEQVNMTDTFGQVMMDNLKSRDCELLGALVCPTLQSQIERFKKASWSDANASDMTTVYQCLPYQDKERVERIEMLDEVDLFYQLSNHYCISWSYNDEKGLGYQSLGFG